MEITLHIVLQTLVVKGISSSPFPVLSGQSGQMPTDASDRIDIRLITRLRIAVAA
ncbi:hypothetical protein [Burkholderia stagnalis]|uniref:hypothetical protein n=1 Tax=Burkholderia stagnalis TaxID=1503054 RepID=UPI0012D9C35E|nr:hypothetical protein [Burkholderia stagnalis]